MIFKIIFRTYPKCPTQSWSPLPHVVQLNSFWLVPILNKSKLLNPDTQLQQRCKSPKDVLYLQNKDVLYLQNLKNKQIRHFVPLLRFKPEKTLPNQERNKAWICQQLSIIKKTCCLELQTVQQFSLHPGCTDFWLQPNQSINQRTNQSIIQQTNQSINQQTN